MSVKAAQLLGLWGPWQCQVSRDADCLCHRSYSPIRVFLEPLVDGDLLKAGKPAGPTGPGPKLRPAQGGCSLTDGMITSVYWETPLVGPVPRGHRFLVILEIPDVHKANAACVCTFGRLFI